MTTSGQIDKHWTLVDECRLLYIVEQRRSFTVQGSAFLNGLFGLVLAFFVGPLFFSCETSAFAEVQGNVHSSAFSTSLRFIILSSALGAGTRVSA